MEQRISYTLGFDLPTPAGRPALGGCFGLASNVPSILRGPAEGFVAAALIRPRTSEWNGALAIGSQFIAGSYDFPNGAGWALVYSDGTIQALCGSVALQAELPLAKDSLVLLTWDGTTAYLYINGVEVYNAAPTYLPGPDNFGIGGTTDPSFAGVFGVNGWGAMNLHIGGVMVASPSFVPEPTLTWTSSPPFEQLVSVFSASDMVNAQPSPVPGATPPFPQANYLWSTRRGLPHLVDNGSEVWVDQIAGLELARLGLQVGASVAAHAPDWSDVPFFNNEIPPS